jgi:imidazolonepropionase-like amidohydrolase
VSGLRGITAAALAALLGACALVDDTPVTVTSSTLIDNVTIVDVRDGSLRAARAIALDGSRIVRVASAGSIRAAGAAETVDAAGKYAVPGFLDMHAHALAAADRRPPSWPLMIANGITGFREMSGSPELIERGQRLDKEIADGAVTAPALLAQPGRLFSLIPDGRRVGIATAEAAAEEVRRQKAQGAGFIKIIAVNREVFFATVDEAKKQGLSVVGHLSPVVSATEASNAGMRAMEHLGAGLIAAAIDCSTDETAIRDEVRRRAAAPRLAPPSPPPLAVVLRLLANPLIIQIGDADLAERVLATWSEERCRTLARTFVRNGTWQIPTLIRLRTMQFGADPAYRADPNLRYVDAPTRKMWQDVADEFATRVPAHVADIYKRFYDLQLRMVKLFKQEGVQMLAGADMTGQWDIPGFGLHQEFDELAKAGLSPLEILQMTTLNGARFLGREATMGAVEEGKIADLVLLDANPVASAANLHGIWGVVLRGRYLSKAALEKMKEEVAGAYSN